MILVAGLLAVASVVMNPSPPSGQGEPEKTLQDASATRLKSMTSGDAEGWGRYTTDDFIVIEADGGVKTKAQRMTEIKGTTTPPTGANTALAESEVADVQAQTLRSARSRRLSMGSRPGSRPCGSNSKGRGRSPQCR